MISMGLDFYIFQGNQCKLTHFMIHNFYLLLGFRNFKKLCVSQQKNSFVSRILWERKIFPHKYKTWKHLRELDEKLYIITEKINNPLSIEVSFEGTVIETVFPNLQGLLKIYVSILSLEAAVGRGFSKMGQIIKKRTALTDNNFEMLVIYKN